MRKMKNANKSQMRKCAWNRVKFEEDLKTNAETSSSIISYLKSGKYWFALCNGASKLRATARCKKRTIANRWWMLRERVNVAKQHLRAIVVGEWINHKSLVISECATLLTMILEIGSRCSRRRRSARVLASAARTPANEGQKTKSSDHWCWPAASLAGRLIFCEKNIY